MKESIISFLIALISVFVITVLVERKLIPILKSYKVGQKILEIGPRWHKNKEGTPIMGGLAFVLASLIAMLGFSVYYLVKGRNSELIPIALTYGLAFLNGTVGYLDDYTKLIKKQNEGFKEYQKLILQFLIAILYVVAMAKTGNMQTTLSLPFTTLAPDLGFIYYIIVVLFIVALVNSANFTDGVDGLLSSVSAVMSIALAILSIVAHNGGLAILSGALPGSTLGFLVYNLHPARVFMGDTGSLFIGGVIAGAAIMINEPIAVLFIGIIYVIEIASVVIQRGYYKLTKKRFFKMAPIHHHFEICKWNEPKICIVFSLIALIGSGIGVLSILLR